MDIITITDNIFQTNTYLLVDNNRENAVLIDPGADAEDIVKHLLDKGLKLMAILITHGHFDHIGAVDEIIEILNNKGQSGIKVFAHKQEAEMMENAQKNLSKMFMAKSITAKANSFIKNGDIINLSNTFVFECFEIFGHTNNSICYYNSDNKVLFTGDTLMAGTIGRTDFNKLPSETLVNSIKERLYSLPEDTIVCSGHGINTTLGFEKKNNQYLI